MPILPIFSIPETCWPINASDTSLQSVARCPMSNKTSSSHGRYKGRESRKCSDYLQSLRHLSCFCSSQADAALGPLIKHVVFPATHVWTRAIRAAAARMICHATSRASSHAASRAAVAQPLAACRAYVFPTRFIGSAGCFTGHVGATTGAARFTGAVGTVIRLVGIHATNAATGLLVATATVARQAIPA